MRVTKYRGLLTDRDREIFSGIADVSGNYVYQTRSRLRQKIDRMRGDIDILEKHHPDLAEQLRESITVAA